MFDIAVAMSNHRQRLGEQGHECPKLAVRSCLFEHIAAVGGMPEPIGLHDCRIDFSAANLVEVVDGARRDFGRATNAV